MTIKRLSLLFPLALALAMAACAPVASQSTAAATPSETVTTTPLSPEPSATPAPSQTPLPELGPAERKYRVLEAFPDFFYCDPDLYPIARGDEADLAVQRFPELQAEQETFDAILSHLGLSATAEFSPEQQLQIYREYKKLAAIVFERRGEDDHFQIQVAAAEGMGELVSGLVNDRGEIMVLARSEAIVSCPICLAAGTRIDTPDGPQPVESLRPGDLVWTLDGNGERVVRPLQRVSRTLAAQSHSVVHLVMADGRELWVSPGHPTADGRSVGALQAGDRLSGGVVASAALVAYRGPATYDLLPAGESGFYWANGILLGSTLGR